MPPITTPDSTSPGGRGRPTILPWTSSRPIAPNSILSNECGSSHVVVACTIVTSQTSTRLPARSKPNSLPGQLATRFYGDYAHLLKTFLLDQPRLYFFFCRSNFFSTRMPLSTCFSCSRNGGRKRRTES